MFRHQVCVGRIPRGAFVYVSHQTAMRLYLHRNGFSMIFFVLCAHDTPCGWSLTIIKKHLMATNDLYLYWIALSSRPGPDLRSGQNQIKRCQRIVSRNQNRIDFFISANLNVCSFGSFTLDIYSFVISFLFHIQLKKNKYFYYYA